jgi:hypothetical protein
MEAGMAAEFFIGESLVGDGNEVAHIDLIIGSKSGPAGAAFTQALSRNTDGFTTLLAVVTPNLAAKPDTVLFNRPIIGKRANEIPPEKIKLAMALPGERPRYLLQSIQRRHFEGLAKRLGLAAQADALIDEMLANAPDVIDKVSDGLPKTFPAALLERVVAGLRKSAAALAPGK